MISPPGRPPKNPAPVSRPAVNAQPTTPRPGSGFFAPPVYLSENQQVVEAADWQSRLLEARKTILQRLLQVILVLAVVNLLYWTGMVLGGTEPWSVVWNNVLLLAAVVFINLLPSARYRVRSLGMLLTFWGASVYFTSLYGAVTSTVLMLSVAGLLGAVLVGVRTGALLAILSGVILLISDLTTAGVGQAMENMLVFTMLNVMIQYPLGLLLASFEKNLAYQQSLARGLLDDRRQLQARAQELERRDLQIRTAAEIIQVVNRLSDPQTTLRRAAELLVERFGLYYVGVFLLDESEENAVLRAAGGDPGAALLAAGHSLRVGGASMVGTSIAARRARIALDVGQEAVRFDNPHLPLTRSELALPLLSGERILGALSIQSTQPAAFDQQDLTVMQGIADNLAIAIDNGRLFNQAQERLEEVQTLHRQYLAGAWSEFLQDVGLLQAEKRRVGDESAAPTGAVTQIQKPLLLRDQVIGIIELEVDPQRWDEADESLVQSIATQAALALENARLLEQSQRTATQERRIADISGKVWAATDVETILSTTLSELGRVLRVSEGSIRLEVADEPLSEAPL